MYGVAMCDGVNAGGAVFLGYVGKSRQLIEVRLGQHLLVQPWSDVVVQIFVIAEGMWTDDELSAIEAGFIASLRPAFNIEGNEGNPDRIPPWVALEQRHARDRAAGRPLWVRPARTPRATPAPVMASGWHRLRRRRVRWSPAMGWAALWMTVALATAVWSVVGPGVPVTDGALVGVVAGSLVTGFLYGRGRRKRRRRARRR